jgi:hypothetical protein
VQYTVFQHGRPIGESDLGFATAGEGARMGWFYPNALGETLMPVFGAVLPALCALARRDDEAHCTRVPAAAELGRESAEYADWREAMHHVDQIELELRRADGTVIPTTQISIRDMEALRELARHERASPMEILDDDVGCTPFVDEDLNVEGLDDEELDDEELDDEELDDEELDDEELDDEELDLEDLDDDASEAELEAALALAGEWEDLQAMHDGLFGLREGTEMGRYQIFVQLADGAIP